ncbi:hypothetical protein TIFTF001_048922, partial [Ficus carica]
MSRHVYHAFLKTDSSPPVKCAVCLPGYNDSNGSLAQSKTASDELEAEVFPLSPKTQKPELD